MISGVEAHRELAKYRGGHFAHGITMRNGLLAPSLARKLVAAVNNGEQAPRDLVAELDGLSEAKRSKVFRAISSSLGEPLARWWVWAQGAPYQAGWNRRAYRSPNPDDSGPQRFVDLAQLLKHAAEFPQPLAWHAEWLLHFDGYIPLGPVFAAAMDDGDPPVRSILVDSARTRHTISGPTTQGHIALLASADPANWDVIADLLRAAGRSEGLRQSILEAADLAHPSAFARILDVVLEHV